MSNTEIYDVIPEPSQQNALVNVVAEGDPDVMLAVLEKKAALAGRLRQAIEHIVVSQTYPEDWTVQGDKACLASAGAERIGRNFPIQYEKVEWKKETFSDAHGAGYRYIYSGYASLYDRKVSVEGSYSTRDEFLGKKGGSWRPLEDINEGDIRSAAHHIFCGNAVKALLGLRGLPVNEYRRIMGGTGRDSNKSATVQRGKGTQGGTSADDHTMQKELAELCVAFANGNLTVQQDDQGNWSLIPLADSDSRDALEIAKDICVKLSSFTNKEGKTVDGKGAKDLKGKWLEATLGKARKLNETFAQEGGADDGWG